MHVHDHLPLEELQDLAKAVIEKRIWVRYQAVILASQGRSAAAVALALGCSVRSVQNWVARYNRGGPEALRERPHPGRPPRLAWPGQSWTDSASGWRPGPRPRTASAPSMGPTSGASSNASSA